MAIFVKNLNPCLLFTISGILGRKYLGLFNNLFSYQKPLTQWTLPSFLGIINVGEIHLLQWLCSSTPLSMGWLSSFRKTCMCVCVMGYGLQKMGIAFGSRSFRVNWDSLYLSNWPKNSVGNCLMSLWSWRYSGIDKREHWEVSSCGETELYFVSLILWTPAA